MTPCQVYFEDERGPLATATVPDTDVMLLGGYHDASRLRIGPCVYEVYRVQVHMANSIKHGEPFRSAMVQLRTISEDGRPLELQIESLRELEER